MQNLVIELPEPQLYAFLLPAFELFGREIGPLGVRWYALGYIVGIIFAWWVLSNLSKRADLWGQEKSPFNSDDIDDFVFYATLGILLGGRIGYVLFYQPSMLADPLSILKVWEGGMASHGGFIGVFIAVIAIAISKKINLLNLADAVALASPFGLGLVRLANFNNQELYGRVSDAPWAMVFTTDETGLPRHPSQLYESALEGFVLLFILWLAVYRFGSLKAKGLTTGIMLTGYAISRIIVENFREPDSFINFLPEYLTMGMILSVPFLIMGLVFLYIGIKNSRKAA